MSPHTFLTHLSAFSEANIATKLNPSELFEAHCACTTGGHACAEYLPEVVARIKSGQHCGICKTPYFAFLSGTLEENKKNLLTAQIENVHQANACKTVYLPLWPILGDKTPTPGYAENPSKKYRMYCNCNTHGNLKSNYRQDKVVYGKQVDSLMIAKCPICGYGYFTFVEKGGAKANAKYLLSNKGA